jgi:hypothetical protein
MSKRKNTKISRLRDRIVFAILFLSIGVYSYFKNDNIIYIIIFCMLSVVIFFIDPLFGGMLYKRHISKLIDEDYNDKKEKIDILKIENEYIFITESGSESEVKLKINEIIEIVEIKTNYFLITGNNSAIVLPKDNETINFIEILINNHNVKHNIELNWKL